MKISMMRDITAVVLAALLLSAAAISCGAGMGHNGRDKAPEYEEHYATVMAGETLWDKCQKYTGKEDIRVLVDRVRADNDISDPGKLQPGQRIMIRTKH